jgi:hypothetical protein
MTGTAGARLTNAELDNKVRSLASVGGIYEDVARIVEHYERPRCTDAHTPEQQDGTTP